EGVFMSSQRRLDADAACPEVLDWVDRRAAHTDLEVEVAARRDTGCADVGDDLARADPLAVADRDTAGADVRVGRLRTVAVVDLDVVAVTARHAGEDHRARGCRVDGGATAGCEIDTTVKGAGTVGRGHAPPVSARDVAT